MAESSVSDECNVVIDKCCALLHWIFAVNILDPSQIIKIDVQYQTFNCGDNNPPCLLSKLGKYT